MWFQFPKGIDQIAVNQQVFLPEHSSKVDGERVEYFRAPDHFAGQILDLGLGFRHVEQPKGAPEDLAPASTTLEIQNIEALAGKIGALEIENDALRAGVAELKAERDDLKVQVNNLEPQLKNAEADLKEAQAEIAELKASAEAETPVVQDSTVASGITLGAGVPNKK